MKNFFLSLSIDRNAMNDGFYFFTLKEEGKMIAAGKIIVE